MDGQKFDKLTRAFATGTSRRSLLKLMGGATVAGVAGVKLAAPSGVFAQDCPGDGSPGSCCTADADCAQGYCVIQGDVGAQGICACTESGLGDPWANCSCASGTQSPCGDSGYICCTAAGAALGASGYCTDEELCVSDVPDTGSGSTADANSWIAPAAALGAAAVVMAYKSREAKPDTEA